MVKFERFEHNPILVPNQNLPWQAKSVFNPAVVYGDGKVHLVYRAQSRDNISVFGYAMSRDGYHIDQNLDYPIYTPREGFELKTKDNWNSGCEDPRITRINDRYYMTYTAYDGLNPPRVALTSIQVSDFLSQIWNWETPKLISPPGVDDKDSCILKHKNRDEYFAFHRLGNALWYDNLRNLDFPSVKYLTGGIMAQARSDKWDNIKIGIGPPPIETENGWLLLYHGVSNPGFQYKIGAMLLSYDDPRQILGRTDEPILEPEMSYEKEGIVQNAVFGCGAVIINEKIFLYYGGADSVVCGATINLKSLVDSLLGR